MWEWFFLPVDSTRAHDIEFLISWHARLMVVAWGILLPVGVVVARFFKIWPGQDWPRQLDNVTWWRSHLTLQWSGAVLAVCGLGLILLARDTYTQDAQLHRWFGWCAMALLFLQVLGGLLRGTKGGPTQPTSDGTWSGDHYDMSGRRIVFEYAHKSCGYSALVFAMAAIVLGLWHVNAVYGLWLMICLFWIALLILSVILQLRGRTIDTYQAIWGPDEDHPGNRIKPIGFGIRRPK